MKRLSLRSAVILTMAFAYCSMTGFECSSPDVTGGKMYYQQYQNTHDTTKLNQALASFQKDVAQHPNSAEGWYWLGFVYGIKKDYMNLNDAWAKSRAAGPEMHDQLDANSLYFWGQAYETGRRYFQKAEQTKDASWYRPAAECFQAATVLEPDSSAKYGAYVNWAFALIKQGRSEEALVPLQMQNEKKPNPDAYRFQAQLILDKANTLKKNGQTDAANAKFDEAIGVLNTGLVKFPKDEDLNQTLLNTYVAAGRLLEAKPRIQAYADANPKDKLAQYAYGTVLLEAKQYGEAITYFERALVLDPAMENALYNMCVAYLRWGIAERDADVAKNPDAPTTKLKDYCMKAMPRLEELLKLKSDNAQNWDLAGKIYTAAGMKSEAEAAYKKLDELSHK